jgi:hypothetical protein
MGWGAKTARMDIPVNPETKPVARPGILDFLFAGETTHQHIRTL